jgi:NAD(P)-dependent dehydrogenase (short-subunit alcohol dehydrogenase family)
MGSLDLLFVDAGVTAFAPLEEMTAAVYDEVLGVNARGAYFTVQRLATLIARGRRRRSHHLDRRCAGFRTRQRL